MSKADRLKARLPRGFADRAAVDLAATDRMLERIRATYALYGFEALETPFVEYTDALGKFLPDQDRPNEGVFSFQDDDEQWLSLRYDLTAPLARHVAERLDQQALTLPLRSYRSGWVFRNEKPGPGRFRQFMQCDADIVGAGSPAADAEMCMMMADTLEAVGIAPGDYVVKVNNRKVLDGVMEAIGLGGEEHAGRRLTVLRALDKYDRLGSEGVTQLLGSGRKDESGDFTRGAGLAEEQAQRLLKFLGLSARLEEYAQVERATAEALTTGSVLRSEFDALVGDSAVGSQGLDELSEIAVLISNTHHGKIIIDPSVVRGLEYYTGPVFEAELTFPVVNEAGETVRFGSVAGGGRYDGLVGRFRGEPVPATGFSIGVSRLLSALQHVKSPIVTGEAKPGPVVVLVMDRERVGDYQRMVATLRGADIPAEMYLGKDPNFPGMKAQMKYADRRGASCVVIQGSQERERGEVQVKDLAAGRQQADAAAVSNAEYRAQRLAQVSVPEAELVAHVRQIIGARSG